MEFFKTSRGGQKIYFEGYTYTKQKNLAKGVASYECDLRRQGECRAKIQVRGEELVGRTNEHTHGPSIAMGEIQKLRSEIRERAVETNERPRKILATVLQHCSEEASVRLPSMATMERTIRKQRQVARQLTPPNEAGETLS